MTQKLLSQNTLRFRTLEFNLLLQADAEKFFQQKCKNHTTSDKNFRILKADGKEDAQFGKIIQMDRQNSLSVLVHIAQQC